MEDELERQKYFNLKQSNFTYLFLLASFLCINMGAGLLILMLPSSAKNYLLEITEALQLIAYIPLIIYAFKTNVNATSALRLKRPHLKQVLLTLLLAFVCYIIVTFISVIWQSILAAFGLNVEVPEILNDLFNKPAWISILLLCVYAPFFEEFIFRGMILSGYAANKGHLKSALIVGSFFGLLHGFLPSVVPTAFLGVIIALVVLYTGSIFAGMIYHMLHNLLAYTMVVDNYFIDLPWKLGLMPAVTTEQGALLKFIWMLCWTALAVFAAVIILRTMKKGFVPPERQKADTNDKTHRLILAFALGLAAILVALSSITMIPGIKL
jgi:membrane protease YdiL (CAAX protease family)